MGLGVETRLVPGIDDTGHDQSRSRSGESWRQWGTEYLCRDEAHHAGLVGRPGRPRGHLHWRAVTFLRGRRLRYESQTRNPSTCRQPRTSSLCLFFQATLAAGCRLGDAREHRGDTTDSLSHTKASCGHNTTNKNSRDRGPCCCENQLLTRHQAAGSTAASISTPSKEAREASSSARDISPTVLY